VAVAIRTVVADGDDLPIDQLAEGLPGLVAEWLAQLGRVDPSKPDDAPVTYPDPAGVDGTPSDRRALWGSCWRSSITVDQQLKWYVWPSRSMSSGPFTSLSDCRHA
jgi:hypothetical protein